MVECCRSVLSRFPKSPKRRYEYGTAGFRMRAAEMEAVAFRVGLFMASVAAEEQAAIGVMLTASHNPVEDNGIKLVAKTGEMMEGVEEEVTRICNLSDEELEAWMAQQQPTAGTILVGRDTRPSGLVLLEALRAGCAAISPSARLVDCGLVTTPQLHHHVASYNGGVEDLAGAYYAMLLDGFNAVCPTGGAVDVVVDCANGIGAMAMDQLAGRLNRLHIRLINSGQEGELNKDCGADFVKLTRSAPLNAQAKPGTHYASLDGDADRVVFWFFDDEGSFQLLDGDRIAILIAETLQGFLQGTGLRMGVVQTAYANGGSTAHLRKIGVETVMTLTGVKNLHHEARRFDVGIYFEANGHGTVLFSGRARAVLSATPIAGLMGIVNQYVGDAISDLLLVEAILQMRRMSLAQWNAGYMELPSVQLKVPVADRSAITTTNADQTVVTPKGLQAELDLVIAEYPEGRAFIRPSGTENIVRVYAEAAQPHEAKELADRAAALLLHFL